MTGRRKWMRGLRWSTALLAIYTLSAGPAMLLFTALNLSGSPYEETFARFYSPLAWVCEHWPAFGAALTKYVEIWLMLLER